MLDRRSFVLGAATRVFAILGIANAKAEAGVEPRISLNVLYPNHDGARFDVRYYRETHIPLAMKVMKAVSVLLIEGVPMGDSAAAYAMIAHFEFASPDTMKAAMDDPGMPDVRADVAKFTDIKPIIMLGRS